MKLVLAALLVVAFSLAGAFGASLLRPSGPSAPVADAGHGAEPEKSVSEPKSSGHGGKDDASASDESMYYKFSREFVVPIMRRGEVESLVIIHIQIEADPKVSASLFRMDPKLRDNIMTSLIALSHETDALQNFAEVQNYETIRATLLRNLRDVVPDGLKNVLIVDIGRQNL